MSSKLSLVPLEKKLVLIFILKNSFYIL